jgi:hypothetical protein
MVELVVAAVMHLGEPILVGGPEAISNRRVEAGKSFIESLARGLDEVKTESFLLVTADLPFLTPSGVDDFIARCDRQAMLNYPIIDIADAENQFPGMKRTTLKLRDGRFTGGNIALIQTDTMRNALPIMNHAYEARKKPLRLAGIVGPGTLLRVVLGKVAPQTLTIGALEGAVARFLGGSVRAVKTPFAEIGADIDNLEQWRSIKDREIPQNHPK